MPFLVDLTGKKFGRLLVLNLYSKGKKTIWNCVCDCGNNHTVDGQYLKNGKSISCGCYRSEITTKRKTIHGLTDHRLYAVWSKIKDRCLNKKNPAYKNYGGRGIIICDEWKNSAEIFINWCLNNGWQAGFEIDRIKNDEGYRPDNCRFVIRRINANNKRNNRKFMYNGEMKSMLELEEICGIPSNTILRRVRNYGWSLEQAMTVPKRLYEIKL